MLNRSTDPKPWLELRTIRELSGLTPRQLHILAGMSESYLSDLERGIKRNPSPQVIAKLAKALGVPLAVLIPRDEPLSTEAIEEVLRAGESAEGQVA